MNCKEFSKQISELAFTPESLSTLSAALLKHAAICSVCAKRLEVEQSLTAGLKILAADEEKFEAPSSLRNKLLSEFNNEIGNVSGTVVSFPRRTNWTRWALAAAATLILGLLVFSARWVLKPTTIETARSVTPEASAPAKIEPTKDESVGPMKSGNDVAIKPTLNEPARRTKVARSTPRTVTAVRSKSVATEVASAEVKSEFVPLTYLNDATAMDSGIVVRVEIAREQLATLGLPFDLDRADDIVKADIVLGDDGVARAIRLVQ